MQTQRGPDVGVDILETFHSTNLMTRTCAICHDSIESAAPYGDGDIAHEYLHLPCGHAEEMHTRCLSRWGRRSPVCPLCRTPGQWCTSAPPRLSRANQTASAPGRRRARGGCASGPLHRACDRARATALRGFIAVLASCAKLAGLVAWGAGTMQVWLDTTADRMAASGRSGNAAAADALRAVMRGGEGLTLRELRAHAQALGVAGMLRDYRDRGQRLSTRSDYLLVLRRCLNSNHIADSGETPDSPPASQDLHHILGVLAALWPGIAAIEA